ncbi:major mite allergen Der p 23 [Dermatophagoides pteronyssinus]|uniref:Major mite allergen Der p 23 n=2 Tax=Dermatophagoides pteronyssinus TaxID=6956 RepID=DEP23_DERPT|nr:endochitinase-like [Dermatophagoides pteronyssinus]L7N6F8.1 RecName: Full=Major mite allergen Der p 23; AltName: Full=Major house dust mite allergen Der p 23; Short=Major HDM allergen Der p 23; AltName: Full=Peritrophin-like protein Der p 23; AltName: Allergen=Der p 23; Flags: Precursor [Dermatophagoides pteronyssinus]ACB46292.1 dust mite allergen precursor [Dermatophagoides pteronyssinus]
MKFNIIIVFISLAILVHSSYAANDNDDDPTTTVHPTTTEQPDDKFECPSRFGYFADPKDPHKFYICSNWEAVHKDCPGNTRWNEDEETCT